jgi:hypothetical protein
MDSLLGWGRWSPPQLDLWLWPAVFSSELTVAVSVVRYSESSRGDTLAGDILSTTGDRAGADFVVAGIMIWEVPSVV